MPMLRLLGLCCAGAMLAAILAGCGGAGEVTEVTSEVAEYAGDGHNGTKPLPELVGLSHPLMQTQAVATALRLGEPPVLQRVPAKSVNWYRIPPIGVDRPLLVTLQPTADEDSDLYLFPGSATGYGSGATCLGSSNRLPLGNTDRPGGFAPDWVVLEATDSKGWPAAQVAVWGAPGGATPKHYRIECDPVWGLTVGGSSKGATLTYRDSHWYRFPVKAGHSYWIEREYGSADGRCDVYAYLGRATRYLGAGAFPQLDATETGTCYLRLYGSTSAACPYTILVDMMW
ncbi:MAG: hypothetical protein HPY69_17080 [Armatimonadetes bacterium]|nr:hypothetical protein [Armatimonadota bacterium]